MRYTHLGTSGLEVSRICLGTMNFGPYVDEGGSHALMDLALDAGINFLDTANGYGNAGVFGAPERDRGRGATEEIIGRWFALGGGRREKTVLATKVYVDMIDWPNHGRLSALNIRRALDASLRRLQTDHIDLYQFHHVDRGTPWDEIWQAIDVAITQGKILYAGSSNFAGWHIAQAQESAKAHGLIGLRSEQSLYNLLARDIELEVIPAASAYGLGILPWSPLQGGVLGGALRKESEGGRRLTGSAGEMLQRLRPRIEQYEAFADELGHSAGEVALAWLLHQPAVTAPVVGPRTREQLESAIAALDVSLDGAALARLDELFPGYRPAPEHYAW
jgi:NDP-hexose C3-ketoreductase / dTDP-4-oxo-2-deoxy-alpha-D-pentos-2-ene 2,3-reductase